MSQQFTFPPPPPPPPKPAQSVPFTPSQTRGGHRGRGNSGGRGRGRGQYPTHNQSHKGFAGRSNGAGNENSGFGGQQQHQHQAQSANQHASYGNTTTRPYSGQKRDYSVAFQPKSEDALRKSRPLAPPAVPSFGVDFESLLAKKPETVNTKIVEVKPAKVNALGLTPRANGNESDDSGADEEAALARQTGSSDALQFEYKGQMATLTSKEDIAAWINERRKKWPTQAKRETAEKEAADKQRKWREEKEARVKVSQEAAKARKEEFLRQKTEREKSRIRQQLLQEQVKKAKERAVSKAPQTDAEVKAERLRRKAEKIAKQLEAAEQALQRKQQQVGEEADIDDLVNRVDRVAASQQDSTLDLDDVLSSSTPSSAEDPDDTSSSGSSDSGTDVDSNSEPEESGTKRSGPERTLAPPRKTAPGATSDTRQPCQKFMKTGQCRFGRKCRYRHDKADRKAVLQHESTRDNHRKGLYQIMVDKEVEEERRRTLRAIVAIGDAGLLDDPRELDRNVGQNETAVEAQSSRP